MGFLKRDDAQPTPQTVAAVPVETEPDLTPAEAPHIGAYQQGSTADIPQAGLERLQRMKGDLAKGFSVSHLSVEHQLMFSHAGFDVLGIVQGSSVYHIGFQQAAWNRSQEVGVLTQAMYHARELAITRLEEEADQIGADGVVALELRLTRYEWGHDMLSVLAIGTAVKHRSNELFRAPNGRPFTTNLGGKSIKLVLESGHRPIGMVMGNCVYHVAHQSMRAALKQAGRNQEMPNFTQALYDARELAMSRVQAEAEELRADSVIATSVTEGSHGWGSHVIEFFALGTAVVKTAAAPAVHDPAVVMTLP
jgi:uncharacterized protein YbjQ (UPF0145 family)